MSWKVGDRVVTYGTQRAGFVISTPHDQRGYTTILNIKQILVKFDDDKTKLEFMYHVHAPEAPRIVLEQYRIFLGTAVKEIIPNNSHSAAIPISNLLYMLRKMRASLVDLEDVAAFFKDSERKEAHGMLSFLLPLYCKGHDQFWDTQFENVRYLGSIGLAAPRSTCHEDAMRGAQIELKAASMSLEDAMRGAQNHMNQTLGRSLRAGSDDCRAQVKEACFACRTFGKEMWMRKVLPPAPANTRVNIWVQHVLPFIPLYSLRDSI